MRYDPLQNLAATDFKGLRGMRLETLTAMLAPLRQEERPFRRPAKLLLTDQLLLIFMYWREYRTQFHLAQAHGVSEATVCRTIRRVKQAFLRSSELRLPGKKALRQPEMTLTVGALDATETPGKRPPKR